MSAETDIQWFIARDGKQHGPVSDVELKKLVELGHLKAGDLVWRQGFPDWRKASTVFPTLGEAARPQSAPAAPAPAAPKAGTPAAPQQKAPAAASPGPGPGPAAGAPTGPSMGRPAQPQHAGPGMGGSPGMGSPGPGMGAPAPSAPGSPDPRRGAGPGFGDARPDQMGTRPLGNAPLGGPPRGAPAGPGHPMSAPGPGLSAGPRPDQRMPQGLGMGPGPAPAPIHDDAPPARRRKAPFVIAGLLVMGGIGAWLGSQYTEQIFAIVPAQTEGENETETAAANLAPSAEKKAPVASEPQPQPAASAPTFQDVDRTMQERPMWASLKKEFPEWYQSRVAEVARLSGENKSEADVTNHLVTELVKLRRENAKYALSASTPRHKDIAAAFLANLRELAREGGDGCYEFISRGEASSVIVSRLQDPARSKQIEAQLIAIVAAISEGRNQPSEHARPVKTDYDLLAGELGRLGWTQADMRLFANPQELAKAPHERVCSMLQDWFAAHLAIQDQASQQRLLFETLKPVVSG